jgi:hypothetical protein
MYSNVKFLPVKHSFIVIGLCLDCNCFENLSGKVDKA